MESLTTSYIVIAAYLLLLVGLGVAFTKLNKDALDYFRSGSQGTWWLIGMSGLMSGISALTFTGNAGKAYDAGLSVLVIYLGSTVGFFFQFLFVGPWFRQLRAVTPPEVIRMRYGPTTQQLYAYAGVPFFYIGAGLWLWGLAIFASSVFGLPLQATIIGLGLVVLFYATTGGSWAVLATDFVQSLVLLPLTLLMAFLALREIGGVGALLEALSAAGVSERYAMVNPPGMFPDDANTWGWAIATIFVFGFGHVSLGASAKFFAVKDGREARKSALLSCVLITLGSAVWFIPPMVGRLLYHDEIMQAPLSNPAEASYAVTAINLLPAGMMGLMVVAMFSATMSSMDTGINRNAAVIVRDIIPSLLRLFKKPVPDDRQQLFISRLLTVVSASLVIGVALFYAENAGPGGMFKVMMDIMSKIGLPMTAPLVLGLFIKRVPRWSAIFTMVCGVVPSLWFYFAGISVSFQHSVAVVLSSCIFSFLLTKLFWKYETEAYKSSVEAFFRRMKTPVNFEEEVGEPNDHLQMRIIGLFTLALAVFILGLSFIQEDATGVYCIFGLGGFLLVFGLGMILSAKRYQKKRANVAGRGTNRNRHDIETT